MYRSFLIALLAIFLSVDAEAMNQAYFQPYLQKCGKNLPKRMDADCRQEILFLVSRGRLWADAQNFYEKGKAFWEGRGAPLRIDFTKKSERDGEFAIQNIKGKRTPFIFLQRKMDPYERLIVLNHELSHFANSKEIEASYESARSKKFPNADCVSYETLVVLRDERTAFLSEVFFWKDSPDWFKRRLRRKTFTSKLIPGTWTYSEYYKELEKRLEVNDKFPMDRYVEIEKIPACARALL